MVIAWVFCSTRHLLDAKPANLFQHLRNMAWESAGGVAGLLRSAR
jgi:hypothetical protein